MECTAVQALVLLIRSWFCWLPGLTLPQKKALSRRSSGIATEWPLNI